MALAIKIGVDCEAIPEEKIIDEEIRYYGFDFYVASKDVIDTEEFIEQKLEENGIPCLRIYEYDEPFKMDEKDLHTKEQIEEIIKRQKGVFQTEEKEREKEK